MLVVSTGHYLHHDVNARSGHFPAGDGCDLGLRDFVLAFLPTDGQSLPVHAPHFVERPVKLD